MVLIGHGPKRLRRTGTNPIMAMMASVETSVTIRPLAGALGAEILGVDIRNMDDQTFESVRRAFLEYQVICIRDQAGASPEDQLAFASRWGEISIHPYVPSIDGYPGIMRIYDANPITQTWHSDTTHMLQPPSITMLLARVLPPVGGDTMFASAYRALEDLSPGMQRTLEGLKALHQGTELAADAGLDREAVEAVHPVVRTHPDTGRKALFVNGNYTKNIDGWRIEESQPLLGFLYQQFARPEITYRHRWLAGDLIMWDNRCTQHAVVGDTAGAERVLHRITIAGDTPV